jgi:membrane dipeptidase
MYEVLKLMPSRRRFARVTVLAWALVLVVVAAHPTPGHAERVTRYPVVDLHVDLPYQVGFKQRSLARGEGQYVAEWLTEGGVSAAVFPLFVPQTVHPRGPQREDLEQSYRRMLRLLPDVPRYNMKPCAGGEKGVGVFFAFEGAAPLGQHLDDIWEWGRRGVQLFGLVHSTDNSLASSAGYGKEPRQVRAGLSPLGVEVVRRAHAVGGLIDVSHASDAAFDDILRRSTAEAVPVVATHSNARALARHTRNLADSQLRAIGRSGGVVGVNFHSTFLLGGPGQARLDDVVRHIRHIATVAGIDHVAIGSDFEGGIRPPAELSDVRGFPRLADALLRQGFSSAAVKKVMGQNARRVLCDRHTR